MGQFLTGLKTILQILMALQGVIVVGKDIFKAIFKLYQEAKKQGVDKEFREAFKEAARNGNTIPIEKAIGNINAGKPTTNPHEDIKERPARDRSKS